MINYLRKRSLKNSPQAKQSLILILKQIEKIKILLNFIVNLQFLSKFL